MRFITFVATVLAANTAFAQQPEPSWYELDDRISAINKPHRSFQIHITTNLLRLLNPLDVTSLAFIATKTPPIALSITPGPELSVFLSSNARPISETAFDEIALRSKPILLHTDGHGIENRIDELREFKINCQFVDREDTDRLNSHLAGIVAIGRLEAVRSKISHQFVAVRYLSRYGKPSRLITINNELVFIDIHTYDRPLINGEERKGDLDSRIERAARDIPRIIATSLSEIFWHQLSDDIRKDFIFRFEKDFIPLTSSVQHPSRKLFTEAFVIACLYPTTFETEPVGTFAIPGPSAPGPPTGELLERIRFVDALLDPIEQEFLDSIPADAYEAAPAEPAEPEIERDPLSTP